MLEHRCWDGVNLDSPDHKSHVAYPETGTFETTGPCPASHPVRLPQLMYEIMWDTTPFNDPELWPEDGSQPFVYSMGDQYVPFPFLLRHFFLFVFLLSSFLSSLPPLPLFKTPPLFVPSFSCLIFALLLACANPDPRSSDSLVLLLLP